MKAKPIGLAAPPGGGPGARSATFFALLLVAACRSNVTPQLEEGDRALALGQPRRAIEHYQAALTRGPNARAQRGLGLAFEELGSLPAARRHLEAALDGRPDDVSARLGLSRVQAREGAFAAAAQTLLELLRGAPDHTLALCLLSVYAERRPLLERATESLLVHVHEHESEAPRMARLALAGSLDRLDRRNQAQQERDAARAARRGEDGDVLALSRAALLRGQLELSAQLSEDLTERRPDARSAWKLLTAARLRQGETSAAYAALARLGDVGTDPELRLLRARVRLRGGLPRQAARELAELLSEPLGKEAEGGAGLRSEVTLTLAKANRELGELDASQKLLESLLDIAPVQARALLQLAQLELVRGRPAQAQVWLGTLSEEDRGSAEAHRAMGRAQLALGALRDAETEFRALWEIAPQSAEPRWWLATTLLGRGQDQQAQRLLEGTLRRFPDHLPSLTKLLELFEQRGGTRAAQRALAAHAKENAGLPTAQAFYGTWLSRHGQMNQAVEAYRNALRLEPAHLEATLHLGLIYAQRDRRALARALLDAALSAEPTSPQVALMAADLYGVLGDATAAQAQLQRVLAMRPGHPLALARQALLAAEQPEQLERAAQWAEEALRESPRNADALDARGWVLHRKGEPTLALPLLQRATSLAPQRATFQYHLGTVAAALGKPTEAREALERALKLEPAFPRAREVRARLAKLRGR